MRVARLRDWLAAFAVCALSLSSGSGLVAAPASSQAANTDEELVYLDPDGVIRVIDPQSPANSPAVSWNSPTSGWRYLSLGDFNADGDLEIVAVGENEGAYRLAVFDPVIEGDAALRADGTINAIPWAELYNEVLPGEPLVVGAGNFHLTRPGDEIVVLFRRPPERGVLPDDPYRYVVMSAPGNPPTGREWDVELTFDAGSLATWIDAGNLNGTGPDEIAVINREGGSLSVFAIMNGTLERILFRSFGAFHWLDGDIGQFMAGGDEELAAGRETAFQEASLFVLQYADGSWTDAYYEYNDPPPDAVWFADIAGNGDDEVVVLRRVPVELGSRPRLFVRDNGNDTVRLGELPLDADNGYRTGVGGDVDADGRDEIVIVRGNRIRVFTEPERSANYRDYDVATDSAMIVAGNLDANGLAGASRLAASPSSISEALTTGSAGPQHLIALSDPVNSRSIPFTLSLAGNSAWVKVAASSTRTPATIGVVFDATGLAAGDYSDRLIIDTSNDSVVNAPIAIDLALSVRDGLAIRPPQIVVLEGDCPQAGPRNVQVTIAGTAATTYTLGLVGEPAWVSVNPLSGTAPGTATLTVSPSVAAGDVATTTLVARGVISPTDMVNAAPVMLLCVESTVHLPLVFR